MEAVQYSRGLTLVQWRANISIVEVVHYSGGRTSVQWRARSLLSHDQFNRLFMPENLHLFDLADDAAVIFSKKQETSCF